MPEQTTELQSPSNGIPELQKAASELQKAASELTSFGNGNGDQSSGAAQVVLQGYPGYAGKLSVKGEAISFVSAGELTLKWDLHGTDDVCSFAGPEPNSNWFSSDEPPPNACGLRIHAGKSCTNSSDVGGVLGWNLSWAKAGHGKDNPWFKVTYASVGSASKGITSMKLAQLDQGLSAILGKPFVVYDSSGERAACGMTVPGSPDPPQSTDLFVKGSGEPVPESPDPPQSAASRMAGFGLVSVFSCCMLTLIGSRST
jgi:hypothetical protein